MKLKIFKSGVAMIMTVLLVESFPLPASGQIADNFAADSSLNTSLWTTPSSLLTALATDTSSPPNTFLTPTLSFSSAGMQMTGVNGTYQFSGIQSLAASAPPFTLNTTVKGTLSPGNAFAVFLVNSNLSQWLAINGDLIPNTCYKNVWINYTGSGIPLTSAGNALYGNPTTNVFYTVQISVGTDGNASVVLITNGVTIASQSGLSVGNGPFYVVLAQKEGAPCVTGPLAATWQSISVTTNVPASGQIADNFAADSSLNTSLWTTPSSLLTALATDTSSPPNTFLTPTLSFSSAGMQMTGVNGTYQFSGIQSLAASAPPFTLNTTVKGTLSPGNAFAVFLVNSNLSQWLAINGDLIPATCYQNIWINYTGSGIPLTSAGNVLYGNPSTNVWYTIQISGGTDGNASVALMTNGGTIASQSGLSVGNGPFYVVLAQKEGLPCVSGPLAATWQSINVTSSNAPPNTNHPPDPPILVSPTDGALNVSIPPILNVEVSDPDANRLTVTFYGQVKSANAGPDFTIIALPDTQYYTDYYTNIFSNQTDWIVNNRANLNIAYVTQLGDCVDDGDVVNNTSNPTYNNPVDIGHTNFYEWCVATNALYRLESVGIPYGVAVGNHDEDNGQGHSPLADPTVDTTTLYNQYFGTNHFTRFNYYGGNYGLNGDNFYDLFSASGMDFIVLYFEYDEMMTSTDARLTWGNNLLQTYANRRAIVVSHYIINSYTVGSTFGPQGQAIYDALKGNANLFLMLCGHINPDGEGRTNAVFNGNTVTTLLSDYQDLQPYDGNGFLRIYTFSPSNNVIHAQTYSPYLQSYMTDANNQFDIQYNMSGMWVPIATNSNIASGSTTSAAWPGLAPGTQYQWYVTVSDGQATTTGPVWTFTVKTNVPPVFLSVTLTGGMISFDWSAIPGRTYQLQYKTNLAQIDWISLGGTNTATDVTMSATDSIGPDSQRFYRVVMP